MSEKKRVDKTILKVDWCSYEAAKYACEHWYYTRSIAAGKLVKIGAWERGQFVGCVLFGHGANSTLGNPYELKQTECCEMVRVAFHHHETSLTRILSIAINQFLIKQSPGLRLIVSFADSTIHHGGIYQGMNWLYLGETRPPTEYIYKGVQMHGRSVRARWGTSVGVSGLTHVLGTVKHRYVYPLDDAMCLQIQSLSKPFPRKSGLESVGGDTPTGQRGNGRFESDIETPRATSIEGDASSDPVGRGGFNATVALHEQTEGVSHA